MVFAHLYTFLIILVHLYCYFYMLIHGNTLERSIALWHLQAHRGSIRKQTHVEPQVSSV
jgi:hypothetical protein